MDCLKFGIIVEDGKVLFKMWGKLDMEEINWKWFWIMVLYQFFLFIMCVLQVDALFMMSLEKTLIYKKFVLRLSEKSINRNENIHWEVFWKRGTLEQVFLKKSDFSFNWLFLWKLIVWNNLFFTILVTVISKNREEFLKFYFC